MTALIPALPQPGVAWSLPEALSVLNRIGCVSCVSVFQKIYVCRAAKSAILQYAFEWLFIYGRRYPLERTRCVISICGKKYMGFVDSINFDVYISLKRYFIKVKYWFFINLLFEFAWISFCKKLLNVYINKFVYLSYACENLYL